MNRMRPFQDYEALSDQSESEDSISQIRYATSSTSHKYLKYVVTIVSVVIGIGYLTAVEILPFRPFSFVVERSLSDTSRSVLTRTITGAVYLPLIVMNLISLHKLQKSDDGIPMTKHFTTSDLLLLITSASYFVNFVLQNIAIIDILIDDGGPKYILYLVFGIGGIVQIWAQTQFLITAHYVHRSVQKLPKTAEYTLIYTAAIKSSGLAVYCCGT